MASMAKSVRQRLATPKGPAEMEDIGGGHFLIPAAAADYHGAEDELPDLDMNRADAYRGVDHNRKLQQIWDSGNAKARAAAGLKFRPSTTSDHLYGRAVDQSPKFHGSGEQAHQYLETMARHNFHYDTPGDEVHLGYYEGGNIRPDKLEAIARLHKQWEDRAGYGAYEDWRKQNRLADDPALDPSDYDYHTAYEHHAQTDEDTGHFSDVGKRPNHVTFSDESAMSGVDDAPVGGHWSELPDSGGLSVFDAQPVNIANAGGEQPLYDYFARNEAGQSGLILPELSADELDQAGGGPAAAQANPVTLRQYREQQALENMAAAVRGALNGKR
jgi:hypothetical protein